MSNTKLKAGHFFFHSCYYLKISLIYKKFLKYERTLLWLKNRNGKNLKIKYQQRGTKLKYSIVKKAILPKILFSATSPSKILLLESLFTCFE